MPAKGTVVRARLVELLDRGVERPLTLLSAPAGSGKTELLAQWIESGRPPGPVAWVPLGRDDADPHRFWAGVTASLGAAHVDLATLAAPPRGALRPFLTSVINTMSEVDQTLVLVLDDLHLAGSPNVVRDLEWLLEHAPANLRLVAATRSDPLFRLQRLRVAERMSEVRAADLAFTREEASALLGGLELAADDLDLLWRRTEGWAAGLKLARLSLEGHADAHAFVAGFAGGERRREDMVCVNPLTGSAGGSAPPRANPGMLVPSADLLSAVLVPGQVGAGCDDGLLILSGEIPPLGPYVLPGNNYHVYDYALFWAAIRSDALRRADARFAAQ